MSDTTSYTSSDNSATFWGIAIFVFFIIMTILFYYFIYKQYSGGQSVCDKLYPGQGLASLRKREECKDRKRANWALPVSASMIGNNR